MSLSFESISFAAVPSSSENFVDWSSKKEHKNGSYQIRKRNVNMHREIRNLLSVELFKADTFFSLFFNKLQFVIKQRVLCQKHVKKNFQYDTPFIVVRLVCAQEKGY